MGLLPQGAVMKGYVFWKGQAIHNWSEKKRRSLRGKEMTMIFQEPMSSLNPVMTCGYQVAEMFRVHEGLSRHQARDRTLSLFEAVKLSDPERIYRSYPHQISGGQKQRVMLAMAMACRPALLIADEPTTALDVTVQKEILELLKSLQQETGMAILFISHDLALVKQIAHRVMVMYKGRVVEQGSVREIFDNPTQAYTRGLLACRPPLEGRPYRLPVMDDFLNPGRSTEERKPAGRFAVPTDKPLLEVRHLWVRYILETNWMGRPVRWLDAVKNVSLTVHEGEVLGLAGESGCGKSTLGRAVLALQPIFQGEVLYRGRNLFKLSSTELRKIRREIQVVFQDPYAALNPRMRVGEAIAEPLRVHRLAPDGRTARLEAQKLLERVGLSADMYSRYPHEFSGGQRQRICIARALALQPRFLVCDESVAALDVSVQAQILNLLNDLREELGLSFLFISHDLAVVRYMSHRVCIMYQGEIVEEAQADELFRRPQAAYTRRLLAALPELENSN
jgi:peptide/nickel transport system ATP-binding protein